VRRPTAAGSRAASACQSRARADVPADQYMGPLYPKSLLFPCSRENISLLRMKKKAAGGRIGETLVKIGAMTEAQVREILYIQREKYKYEKLFGEIAVELQLVDQETIEKILSGLRRHPGFPLEQETQHLVHRRQLAPLWTGLPNITSTTSRGTRKSTSFSCSWWSFLQERCAL